MEHELRMKREAAEKAFEAQAEKDRTLTRLEELRFLDTSTKDLDDSTGYYHHHQSSSPPPSLLTTITTKHRLHHQPHPPPP
nr:hypothetical protein [Tanacetum cinerariifolium]